MATHRKAFRKLLAPNLECPMTQASSHTALLTEEVQRTLNYFDFFQHALELEELHKYLRCKVGLEELRQRTEQMAEAGRLVTDGKRFALREASLLDRARFEKLNRRKIKWAHRVGRFIQLFPYVRGVYLSGSLSKMGAKDKNDDLDFFIITRQGRVWTAKLLLIAFKKVFLLDSEKYFCINLLMDESKLALKKRTIYTATEAVSLVTLTRDERRLAFLQENEWVREMLPNASWKAPKHASKQYVTPIEWVLERIGGERLERWAREKFALHMVANASGKNGYYETEAHSSAYFPQSIEQQLMAHYGAQE